MATRTRSARHSPARARPPARRSKRRVRLRIRKAPPHAAPSSSLSSSVAATILHPARAPSSHQAMGNPLAIPPPASFLSPAAARRIVILRGQQHYLWSWALALSILLFFLLSAIELGPLFNLWPPPSEPMADLLQGADLLAIFVVGLELWGQYRQTRNKMLFLRQNWLGILALLPIGLFVRAFQAFESLGALHSLQMAGKFEELSIVLPSLRLSGAEAAITVAPRAASNLALKAQEGLTHFSVVTDFLELVGASISRLLR